MTDHREQDERIATARQTESGTRLVAPAADSSAQDGHRPMAVEPDEADHTTSTSQPEVAPTPAERTLPGQLATDNVGQSGRQSGETSQQGQRLIAKPSEAKQMMTSEQSPQQERQPSQQEQTRQQDGAHDATSAAAQLDPSDCPAMADGATRLAPSQSDEQQKSAGQQQHHQHHNHHQHHQSRFKQQNKRGQNNNNSNNNNIANNGRKQHYNHQHHQNHGHHQQNHHQHHQQHQPTYSTTSSSHMLSSSTSSSQDANQSIGVSADYLAQLIKDKKQLSSLPPSVFLHVPRLIDDEINKVRQALFQLNDVVHLDEPMVLPEPEGDFVQLQEKLFVPVDEHPEYNFVGRLLGPRGMTAKQLEQETGCKIMIRGRGSMRDKKKEEQNRGKANWEHLNEDLHVLITVEDTQNRAQIKLRRAIEEVKQLLVPIVDGEDELKKRQLMELAIINGTYRDCNLLKAAKTGLVAVASPSAESSAVPNQTQAQTSFVGKTAAPLNRHLAGGVRVHPYKRQPVASGSTSSPPSSLSSRQPHSDRAPDDTTTK